MARIGIDLDGVLYDFGGALRQFMIHDMGWPADRLPDPKEWGFYRHWGLTDAGFKTVCDLAANEDRLWRTWPVELEDLRALNTLVECGHTLHILTDRQFGTHPGVSHAATAQWLAGERIPYTSLTFTGDKTLVKTDFMIEDKRENYDALSDAGTFAVLLDRPWNQDDDRDGSRNRVRSIAEFAHLVRDLTEEPVPF